MDVGDADGVDDEDVALREHVDADVNGVGEGDWYPDSYPQPTSVSGLTFQLPSPLDVFSGLITIMRRICEEVESVLDFDFTDLKCHWE